MLMDHESQIIERFADGDNSLRDEAIRVHRVNIRLNGLQHGNPHFDFMSEVDNPCPDLYLRSQYRKKLRMRN